MTANQKEIGIIVVDDHRLFRMGLIAAFASNYNDICVKGEAENGGELFALLAHTSADLVLLNINMPGVGGVDVALRLRVEHPNIKILAISGENSAKTVEAMLEAGINGFITKQQGGTDELANAIRSVVSGFDYFGRDISFIMYDIFKTRSKTPTVTPIFTEREREIILLCRDGLLCKEIAHRLNISTSTVNTHKERIFQKLGINSTIEMVQYALKKRIINVE
jgi:DNA-binding NarL/FixJ family response regulator